MQLFLENTEQSLSSQSIRLVLAGEKMRQYFIPSQIIRLEAENSYTRIFCVGQRPLVTCKVLRSYEAVLAPLGFIRTHHSHLVNKLFIDHLNDDAVVMKDASSAGLSRRKRKGVMAQMNPFSCASRSTA